jgi:hypothetical protein
MCFLTDSKQRTRKQQALWIGLSVLLLVLYLAFFHLCVGAEPRRIMVLSIFFSHACTFICIAARGWFLNRFEFAIHLAIGVDIQLEGFIEKHDHYYFYVCAAAFWGLFWIYHFRFARDRKISIEA